MITKIVAIFLIFFFIVLIAVFVWSFHRLNKVGLQSVFLHLFREKWLAGLLTGLFILLFIICGIALLMHAEWAVPVLRNTIYCWLLYLWIYGLKELIRMIHLLKSENATSIAQFMGRSKFFDELLKQSIALSTQSQSLESADTEEAHAVSDSILEALLNDEAFFKEVFPYAIRRDPAQIDRAAGPYFDQYPYTYFDLK